MARRVLLYSILAVVLGVVFLWLRRPAALTLTGAVPVDAHAPTGAALLAQRCAREPHLRPDTRFLDAVGDVAHVLEGAPPRRAEAKWVDGGWSIALEGRSVGRLGEFPGFVEMRDLLIAWARNAGAPDSIGPAQPGRDAEAAAIDAQISALHALHAANLTDRRWGAGHHDRATARLGARALSWLAAENVDVVGAGEAVGARAFAWNAIVAASEPDALPVETALLAGVLGYPAEACSLAVSLPTNEPVRAYLLHHDDELKAASVRGNSTRSARWLAVLRCVEQNDREGWVAAIRRDFTADSLLTLPILGSELALGRFENGVDAGTDMLEAVAADLRLNEVTPARLPTDGGAIAQVLATIEGLLDAMPESADGVFLDRAVLAGWYRAAIYSSLFDIGEHLHDRLSDTESTQDFAESLGDGRGQTGAAAEFERWFSDLVDSRPERAALKADLVGMPHFGAPLRRRTWEAVSNGADAYDHFVRQCSSYLQPRLDTRPENLEFWGDVLANGRFDLSGAEHHWEAAVCASHPRDFRQRAWWAARQGDRNTVERLLADEGLSSHERVELVVTVREMMPEDSLELDRISEGVIARCPDDWELAAEYVTSLSRRHRNDRVRAITSAWLARPSRSRNAFDEIDARNRLAEACLEDGRYDEGMTAIRSAVDSWQLGAMHIGADLLEHQGRTAEAEEVARMAWKRYPESPEAEAFLLGLYWKHGKSGIAARLLAETARGLGSLGLRVAVGRKFVAFALASPAQAEAAVDSLVACGLDDWDALSPFAAAFDDAGHPAAAAPLVRHMRPGGVNDVRQLVDEYRMRKAIDGPAAAARSVAQHLRKEDPRSSGYVAISAVGDRVGELTWLVPMPPENTELAENVWLARLIVALRDSVGDAGQRARLRAWFARPGPAVYRHYGRMLLGLETPDAILALPLDNREEGEAYYYLGLRCQLTGDAAAAARWYSRCVDLDIRSNSEHFWAIDQLVTWSNRRRSLERLSEEHRAESIDGPAI